MCPTASFCAFTAEKHRIDVPTSTPYGVQNDTILTNRPHLHNDGAPQYTRHSRHYLYGLGYVGFSDCQVGPTSVVLTSGLSCPDTDVLACADFTRLARLETNAPQAIVG